MKTPKEYLDEFRENSFAPKVNFEGDILISESQLIELIDGYAKQVKKCDLADVGESCKGGCEDDDVKPLNDKFKCQKCGTIHDF